MQMLMVEIHTHTVSTDVKGDAIMYSIAVKAARNCSATDRCVSSSQLLGLYWVIKMELDYIKLGRRTARRRKSAGIKQTDLADMIGISNNYLSSIERGKEKPSLEIIVKLCSA